MDLNTAYVLESRLISMDGATKITISEFEASTWHNSRVFVWYFQVCKFQKLSAVLHLGKQLQLLTHKLCLDCSWGETEKPILCCVLNSPLERRKALDRLEYRMRLLPGQSTHLPVHSLFASNFLLKHIAVLHFDGMITNHKEIGLGHLLPSWFQDDVFTLPNWLAWALMELNQCLLETLWWACFTRTNRLAPAYVNAHGWT